MIVVMVSYDSVVIMVVMTTKQWGGETLHSEVRSRTNKRNLGWKPILIKCHMKWTFQYIFRWHTCVYKIELSFLHSVDVCM